MNQTVVALKHKVIHDYRNLIKRLNLGYFDNYENILNMIYLIDLIESDKITDYEFVSQYYLTK